MICTVAIGSAARGDADRTSDKDAVIIGSSFESLNAEKKRLQGIGWNVTSYSLEQLIDRSIHGSLFLKHVLDEGLVLSGEKSSLETARDKWTPRTSYADEIEENLGFLTLLRYVPETQMGLLVAVDIVVCSIRNVLIRRLAERGEYVFSWSDIYAAGVRNGLIGAEAGKALYWARRVKNLRRLGLLPRVWPMDVERLVVLFSRLLDHKRFALRGDRLAVERAALAFDERSYGRLRGLELLAATDGTDPVLVQLMRMAASPAYYLSGRMKLSVC